MRKTIPSEIASVSTLPPQWTYPGPICPYQGLAAYPISESYSQFANTPPPRRIEFAYQSLREAKTPSYRGPRPGLKYRRNSIALGIGFSMGNVPRRYKLGMPLSVNRS
jgi:hypothetical protein